MVDLRALQTHRGIALAFFTLWLPCAPCQAEPEKVIFCTYNVRNYVDAKPAESGGYPQRAKPEAEILALIEVISQIKPDILGVCEMGSKARFEDFQKRLAAAGLAFAHAEYLEASDPDRHLALLSRFPILSRQSVADARFTLNGIEQPVRRGFLDVTIEINAAYQLRCVGVHLKSKLPIPEGEALIRRAEASVLRKHLDQILQADPETNLVCYGDFNDSKDSPMFQEVSGPRGTPLHMMDLWARDEFGDRWTHYYKTADEYCRLDYIFVSKRLMPEILKDLSRVHRSPKWDTASDHRPVHTTIVAENR